MTKTADKETGLEAAVAEAKKLIAGKRSGFASLQAIADHFGVDYFKLYRRAHRRRRDLRKTAPVAEYKRVQRRIDKNGVSAAEACRQEGVNYGAFMRFRGRNGEALS